MAAAVERNLLRPVLPRHAGQYGHGGLHRLLHVLAVKPHAAIDLAAKVLHHREARSKVMRLDARRAQAPLHQDTIDRDDGADVLREMRDGAVGQSVFHRRAIGPCRHVHQHRLRGSHVQRLVAAEGGIAFEEAALRTLPARAAQEGADLVVAEKRLLPGPRCGDRRFA